MQALSGKIGREKKCSIKIAKGNVCFLYTGYISTYDSTSVTVITDNRKTVVIPNDSILCIEYEGMV